MPLLTDIIVASPQEVSAVCAEKGRRAGTWPSLAFHDLDNVKLAGLVDVLGAPEAAVALEGQDRLAYAGGNDGPWVFHLPEAMRDALADLDAGRVPDLAEAWFKRSDLGRDRWSVQQAGEIVEGLRGIASRARAEGKPLLLWMCL